MIVIMGSDLLAGSVGLAQPPAAQSGTGAIPMHQPQQPLAMSDIHDIKPIVSIAIGNPWLIYLAIGVIVLLLIVISLWLWRRKRSEEATMPLPPPVPPEVIAIEALQVLARDRKGMLDAQTFYFRLSEILRQYIDRRFLLGASKMTTEEFVPRVERLDLDHDLKRPLIALCQGADPIKFAKASVDEPRMDADLRFVEAFVQQTTSHV
jgi:hypothetical protein